jgi:hypothetical protein
MYCSTVYYYPFETFPFNKFYRIIYLSYKNLAIWLHILGPSLEDFAIKFRKNIHLVSYKIFFSGLDPKKLEKSTKGHFYQTYCTCLWFSNF